MEAVAYIDRISQFSPFARLSYDLGETGVFQVAYSRGAPAADLMFPATDGAQDQLRSLAMFPRLSLSSGSTRLQRNETVEVGFRRNQGAWTYSTSGYVERVRDAAMSAASPAGFYSPSELLPDIASNASIFNAGSYEAYGYAAGVDRKLFDGWTVGLAAGSSGMLAAIDSHIDSNDASELRSNLQATQRLWASARANGAIRATGTRLGASYLWTPSGTLGPAHAWLTLRNQPLIGLNVQIRQPVPTGGMPGRLEMTAEVRNLLAQGYVPVATPDGRQIWLVQFPRALRGGLSFTF